MKFLVTSLAICSVAQFASIAFVRVASELSDDAGVDSSEGDSVPTVGCVQGVESMSCSLLLFEKFSDEERDDRD